MENSSISRFNTGAWVLFVPCALPVVGARYGWANGIVWTLGAVIPGLTALIFTGEAMSVFWSALLGLLGVMVFHFVLRKAPAPRLGKAALDKLNAELRAAGHEIESMR